MKHINLNPAGDTLVISFPYNAEDVEAVRSISGRQYNKKTQNWEVPVMHAAECVSSLERRGFTAVLEVKRLAHKEEALMARMDEFKRGVPAEYAGSLPLFDFQKIGVRFLREMPNALLADVPGLGKSIQTIAALEDAKRVLVLCPASLKYSWKEEIEKWIGGGVRVIDGNKKERNFDWRILPKYTIANYELLLHDWDVIPKEWDVIVCDEATRISNPSAKSVKALKALKAQKKIALTGTPISNSPQDIFSIIDWIVPGYLGTFFQFLNKYCVREPRFNRIVGYKNLDDLSARVGRYMLRRTKEEVMKDMPPKLIEDVVFTLSVEEHKLYCAVRNEIAEEVRKMDFDGRSLSLMPVKMLRLKQLTGHPSILTGIPGQKCSKLMTLRDILQPIVENGEKAIIFTQFAEMAKILNQEFQLKMFCGLITGEMSAPARQEQIEAFKAHPAAAIIVMTEAGAYGLNLQVANYVIHYDAPWSIAKLMQREDRAHRIGQEKPVTVYNLIAKGTIDEYVAKVLHKKQKISVDILQDQERLEDAGISPDDVKEILRL